MRSSFAIGNMIYQVNTSCWIFISKIMELVI